MGIAVVCFDVRQADYCTITGRLLLLYLVYDLLQVLLTRRVECV
jgi:hypothetical protein